MPTYKLSYFDMKGLAEPIRFLFSYGGIPFEDNRINRETFPTVKPNYPFGKLPVLEVDGKVITQSVTICRYVAKLVGLAGKTDLEATLIDEIVDILLDFRQEYFPLFRSKDEEEKAKVLEKIKNEHNPFFLSRLEKIVQENGGHFVNGQLSWADVYFTAVSELLQDFVKINISEGYPKLGGLVEKVQNTKGIKEWRAKRPQN